MSGLGLGLVLGSGFDYFHHAPFALRRIQKAKELCTKFNICTSAKKMGK